MEFLCVYLGSKPAQVKFLSFAKVSEKTAPKKSFRKKSFASTEGPLEMFDIEQCTEKTFKILPQ